jgi:hypothetical protein
MERKNTEEQKERALREENRRRSAANATGGQCMDPEQNRDEHGGGQSRVKRGTGAPGTNSGGPP